jgi:hypothetical protein
MNLTSADDEIEKNYKRFEAFFSTLSCLRFDDILRINDETNLKKIIYLLIDDIQSNIIEYRFTILLARKIIFEFLLKKGSCWYCSGSDSSWFNYYCCSWEKK